MASYFALCNSLWSLTIIGILRFISIIKNSEQAGIQSLGLDYVALWKIRFISIAFTSIIVLSGSWFFNVFPAFFYTIYYDEMTAQTLKPSSANKVFWIPFITNGHIVQCNSKAVQCVLSKNMVYKHSRKIRSVFGNFSCISVLDFAGCCFSVHNSDEQIALLWSSTCHVWLQCYSFDGNWPK